MEKPVPAPVPDTVYTVYKVSELRKEELDRYINALQPICSPEAGKGMNVSGYFTNVGDNLIMGILTTKDKAATIVGGILYTKNEDGSIMRSFVCVKRTGGVLLKRINEEFEKSIAGTKVFLHAVVDPELKVATAHMRNGYKISEKDKLYQDAAKYDDVEQYVLIHAVDDIDMERIAGSPRPTFEDLMNIDTKIANAVRIRKLPIEQRHNYDRDERAAKRSKLTGGRRRRITRRRSSTSARKQSRRRRASVRGA